MSSIIHYTNCPSCGSGAVHSVLSAKDHTVTDKTFAIWECKECTLRFTQDVPDAANIASYYQSENYISHSNTSKGVINRLYQAVRKKTLRQKRKLIEQTTCKKSGSLLDVGSGTGAFVHEMQSHGWQVTGVEPDEGARKVATANFNTELKDISTFFELHEESFDAITLWHVLEHVHDLHNYIEQLKKVLKRDGKLFIAVPNYTSGDESVYKEHWAAYDVPRHLYHFSPASMKVLMEKYGLRIQQYKPMWYDSFYISMLSSKYKNGKTNLFTAFLNGLRSNMKAWSDVKRCSSVIYVINK